VKTVTKQTKKQTNKQGDSQERMRFVLKMCQFGQVKSDENASVIENILVFC